MSAIVVQPAVAEMLRNHGPVVALETAVVTHGLPRSGVSLESVRVGDPVVDAQLARWDHTTPANLQLALAMSEVVLACGATPATIAVLRGELRVGLDDEQLTRLAGDTKAAKASSAGLAAALTLGESAGTTVSATLVACRIAQRAAGEAIRFFATGGIGGVHRQWTQHPDISTDLLELSRSQVCVVCAGCKSLLDVAATHETLETLGVPAIGYRTEALPWFYCRASEQYPLATTVQTPGEIVRLAARHWCDLEQGGSVLVCQSAPDHLLLDPDEIERATELAEQLALERGMSGATRTPFVLGRVSKLTGGRTLQTNIALLLCNAALAARTAVTWSEDGS